MGIHSLPARRLGRIGLVALLGLTLALVTVSAGHSNASVGHKALATTAKKKCKKKKHRSASSAKKKKCKKKVHRVVLPPPGPVVRATLTWSAPDEVDLHAIDSSGNHAGWDFGVNGVVNNIPSAHHNGDIGPSGGTESFTDDIYVVGGPSNREFTYVACLYNGPDPDDYTAAFSAVSNSGATDSLTLQGTPTSGDLGGNDVYVLSFPGGPTVSNQQALVACDLVL
jgi:hypothetical protein